MISICFAPRWPLTLTLSHREREPIEYADFPASYITPHVPKQHKATEHSVATPSPTGRGNRSSSLIALRNTLPFLFFTRRPAAAQGNPVHRGNSLSLWAEESPLIFS
ncbi:Uncharacterised protein [Serratia fonticola]|nr:Uncharacterised protein [Serratia fonticola]CAI0994914.1 Uncharacterised protein [Serratia fonticola]CAI1574849.1 Uncharacterised protein [Serratia fonticola]CAI1707589.1 Uncharacterised protein [Serratia fonticola]CAI1760752.1 Uncharacterised protein [Serratia fonticola]